MANISVTYQDLADSASSLQRFENDINDKLNQAQALIQNLVQSGFVTEVASKAFDQAYSDFTKGATQMIAGMSEMSKYLTGAAQQMQETDHNLAKGFGH